MSIEYTYEIINVDEQARCMEVRYESAGRGPVHVSARLPYQGESLDAVIAMYSPVRYWEDQDAAVVVPAAGTSGSWVPPTPQPPTVQEQIVALEQAHPITHRNLRDLAMAVAAIGELVTGQPAANLPMVQTITALEQQIAELRSQL